MRKHLLLLLGKQGCVLYRMSAFIGRLHATPQLVYYTEQTAVHKMHVMELN
jgi:hypothetical protein